jgi:hypothetical protein
MRVRHKDVELRISRRTLWVGMQAYPLSNVTRVQPLRIRSNRSRLLLAYGRRAGAWVGLGVAGLLVLGCLHGAVPTAVTVLYGVLVLGALTLHTAGLVRRLAASDLWVLSVATSGSPHAALVSHDKQLIYDLTRMVVDAIDNPAVEYEIRVEHIEVNGDLVGGDKYGGDTVNGDKIVFDN